MGFNGVRSGCNVLAYIKDNKKYGMTCAWATLVDYDKLAMLVGGQSETGNNLAIGDEVGVSALAIGQEKIAIQIGEKHSLKINKFNDIPIEIFGNAILIEGAKTNMICSLDEIIYLKNNSEDHLFIFKITKHKSNKDVDYLPLENVIPE